MKRLFQLVGLIVCMFLTASLLGGCEQHDEVTVEDFTIEDLMEDIDELEDTGSVEDFNPYERIEDLEDYEEYFEIVE